MGSSVKVLLMTGGSGTRLWPKSRKSMPKQFMSLGTDQTLFQQTLHRVGSLVPATSIYAVTPPEYLPHIKNQAPDLPESQIIVEPIQHSTTACLAYATAWLRTAGLSAQDVILLLPTDAYVGDDDAYLDSLREAIAIAKATEGVVTIGIKPSYPATGYGYIQADMKRQSGVVNETRRKATEWLMQPSLPRSSKGLFVRRFVEKPDIRTAERYLQEGNFFWNAGMFAWKASTIWQLLADILPADYQRARRFEQRLLAQVEHGKSDIEDDEPPLHETPLWGALRKEYQKFRKEPFEVALIEKAREIYVVPANFEWTDLGTWSVLLDKLGKSATDKNVVAMDSEGCLVDSHHGLVGLLGVSDLIVVNTEDTVFICHRDRDQDVKKFRELLRQRGYETYL